VAAIFTNGSHVSQKLASVFELFLSKYALSISDNVDASLEAICV
jgi:hypothetical protein